MSIAPFVVVSESNERKPILFVDLLERQYDWQEALVHGLRNELAAAEAHLNSLRIAEIERLEQRLAHLKAEAGFDLRRISMRDVAPEPDAEANVQADTPEPEPEPAEAEAEVEAAVDAPTWEPCPHCQQTLDWKSGRARQVHVARCPQRPKA